MPIAIVGILLKVTMVLPLGLVALFMILFVLFSRDSVDRTRKRRLVWAPAVAVVSAMIAEVLWILVRTWVSIGPGPDQGLTTDFL